MFSTMYFLIERPDIDILNDLSQLEIAPVQ